MSKPGLLYISFGFPDVLTGLGLRTSVFLEALNDIFDVDFVFRTSKDFGTHHLDRTKSLCSSVFPVPYETFQCRSRLAHGIDSKNRYVKLLPLLFSKKPIYLNTVIMANNYSKKLKYILESINFEKYKVIHINRLFMADAILEYLPEFVNRGIYMTLDLDDIESVATSRYLKFSSTRPRTRLGQFLRKIDLIRLVNYEKKIIPKFDACIVCSEVDKEKVKQMGLSVNPWVIENAVDTLKIRPLNRSDNQADDILFLGNMGYEPNIDAVMHFAKTIFPIIRKSKLSARFLIVGKGSGELVNGLNNGKDILVIGEVADVRKYYQKASVVVVPLRYGGGTRLKVLEAMAMEKAVISSSLGIEGINAVDGREVVIADSEAAFADACLNLIGNREMARRIGKSARRLVSEKYNRETVKSKIRRLYGSVSC